MFTATVAVSVLLALALTGSAAGKLTRSPAVVTSLTGVGVPLDRFWVLAVLEIAGALGLVVGLWWAPLGIAAAIGIVLYFLGAVGAHVRAHDLGGVGPAAGLLVAAAAALVLRLATA